MTVHSGVRQGAEVETWIGTETNESRLRKQEEPNIGTDTSFTQEKQPKVTVGIGP